MLWWLVWAPDQAVTVAAADSTAAASVAPAALVVRLRPVGGNQKAAALAVRVVAAAEKSPEVEGRCCRCSTRGNDKELRGPVSHGSS